MIKRDECLKLLASKIADDEIVVAAYTTAFEWIAIRPSPLNFISSGAMGLTSSHALGFALAWPDRRIILLDGDGSLLMNLGCLVTNANAAPKNLIHLVFDNKIHDSTGGQPTFANTISISKIAKMANYTVFSVKKKKALKNALNKSNRINGPILIHVHVTKSKERSSRVEIPPERITTRFMSAIN